MMMMCCRVFGYYIYFIILILYYLFLFFFVVVCGELLALASCFLCCYYYHPDDEMKRRRHSRVVVEEEEVWWCRQVKWMEAAGCAFMIARTNHGQSCEICIFRSSAVDICQRCGPRISGSSVSSPNHPLCSTCCKQPGRLARCRRGDNT